MGLNFLSKNETALSFAAHLLKGDHDVIPAFQAHSGLAGTRMRQARMIDKETSKEILHSSGVDLEFNMVSSQLVGMNYAAHLARSLVVVETSPRRKEFLQRTDRKCPEPHGQVCKMLFTRYQS